MTPSNETLNAVAREMIRCDINGCYQAVIASKEVQALIEALRKAQEQFDREDTYATCDVAEDGRCSACKATYRNDRGKGNRGWKMEHDKDCAWVLIDQALASFVEKESSHD